MSVPLPDRSTELTAVHDKFLKPKSTTRRARGTRLGARRLNESDVDLLERARGAANGPSFRLLYDHGDISAYPSHSEADMALVSHLVFWADGDAARVDALFRQSKLFRAKWDEQRGEFTYGAKTIAAALADRAPRKDVMEPLPAGGTLSEIEQAAPATDALEKCRASFRGWLGDDYDTEALDAVLCTLAAERLTGDPLWLLLISGSGNAKTETVQASRGAGAHVISTIASEGALLSGTSKKERVKDATGGLLRLIGARGVMCIKDVTSIISANRDTRATILAALREIHDGQWVRNVGTDGGRSIEWSGRIAVLGAVTTAWDRAHDVVAACGDRFVLVRMDSTEGRKAAGMHAIGNVGHEVRMREELAAAVGAVIRSVDPTTDPTLTEAETQTLLEAADLVTLARTGVEYDYRGDVIDAHAPEMPTRFAKQLAQILRAGIAMGMARQSALALAIRCARDSMPPLRLSIFLDVAQYPESTTHAVRRRLGKPRATVDRQLQALQMLGLLLCDEQPGIAGRTEWHYRVRPGFRPEVLGPRVVPDLSVQAVSICEYDACEGTDISGTTAEGRL